MEIPDIIKNQLGGKVPLFMLYSQKLREKKTEVKSLLFSLVFLLYCLHLVLVVMFENHYITLSTIDSFLTFGKLVPFSIEKYVPLIPLTIVIGVFSFVIYVTLRELISSTQTHWIGTEEGLYVITNHKKVQKIIWRDFFGKIKSYENGNLNHISLYYYQSKLERYNSVNKKNEFFKEQFNRLYDKYLNYLFVFKECTIYAATGTQNTESIIRKYIIGNSID